MSRRTLALLLVVAALGGCAGPKPPSAEPVAGAELRLDLAEIFVRKQAYLAAAPILRRAIEEQPRNPKARILYATVLREQGLYGQAIAQYQLALRLAPRSPAAHAGLGIVHDLLHQGAEAEASHRRATRFAPGVADYWNNLGFSLYVAGRLEEARAALEQALTLDPSLEVAHNNLGFVYARLGRRDEALRSFKNAVGEARAQMNLAVVLEESGEAGEAERCRARALELDPAAVRRMTRRDPKLPAKERRP